MSRDYLIRLPWPPAKTSKNGSQGDYRGKARAAKTYKQACAWECKAQGVTISDAEHATVRVTYCPPRNGRHDWDNLAGRCKQGFDAVAEAVGIDDGNWWPVISERGKKTPGGCVLVHVMPHVSVAMKGVIS